jgi:hypothetical protein
VDAVPLAAIPVREHGYHDCVHLPLRAGAVIGAKIPGIG